MTTVLAIAAVVYFVGVIVAVALCRAAAAADEALETWQ